MPGARSPAVTAGPRAAAGPALDLLGCEGRRRPPVAEAVAPAAAARDDAAQDAADRCRRCPSRPSPQPPLCQHVAPTPPLCQAAVVPTTRLVPAAIGQPPLCQPSPAPGRLLGIDRDVGLDFSIASSSARLQRPAGPRGGRRPTCPGPAPTFVAALHRRRQAPSTVPSRLSAGRSARASMERRAGRVSHAGPRVSAADCLLLRITPTVCRLLAPSSKCPLRQGESGRHVGEDHADARADADLADACRAARACRPGVVSCDDAQRLVLGGLALLGVEVDHQDEIRRCAP